MASSSVQICNRGLQLLGAARITALTDTSVNARAMNVAYEPVRLAELRRHTWNFAIKREQLAASATAPAFGRARAFPLPSDYLRLLPPYPEENFNSRDWLIEQIAGQPAVVTADAAPLNIRYVSNVEDPNVMDAAFREALSHALALATCEELTQSNSKYERIAAEYVRLIRDAKRTNAIENAPQDPVEDTFVTCRA